MRDGVTLYMDIYRPPSSDHGEKVPAILTWSPFGKKAHGMARMEHLPWKMGIRPSTLSSLERFEGPDPAEYVPRGLCHRQR